MKNVLAKLVENSRKAVDDGGGRRAVGQERVHAILPAKRVGSSESPFDQIAPQRIANIQHIIDETFVVGR